MPFDAAEAIRSLYPEEGDAIHQTIYGIVLDAAQAQDLTQATFVRAYREWDPAHLSDAHAWLLGIAAGVAIASFGTRRPRLRAGPLATPQDGNAEGRIGGPPQDQDQDLVARLLRPLNPEQRALVILHDCQQVSSAGIAEALDLPSATVPARIDRAMQVLRGRAHVVGAMPQLGEGGPATKVAPEPTDGAIIAALRHGSMRAAVALPPLDAILDAAANGADAADAPASVSIVPLPPPGSTFHSARAAGHPRPRYLPYLVAVTAAVVLVGIVVGLNLYAVFKDAPSGARPPATPPASTFHGGAGTSTPPPAVAPTPASTAPTPAATTPTSTPVPAIPAVASPPPPAPATPTPPAHGHGRGHGPGPGSTGTQ